MDATSYNRDTGNGVWDVSKVVSFRSMFENSAMDRSVGAWEMDSAQELDRMFYNAATFSDDLCAWQNHVPSDASVTDMFVGTSCPDQGDPDLSALPASSLCNATCTLVDDGLDSLAQTPAPAPDGNTTTPDGPSDSVPTVSPTFSEMPSASDMPSASEMPSSEGGVTPPVGSGSGGDFTCFETNEELGAAVREYVKDPSSTSMVAETYGYPINTWCVDRVTSMDSIFKGQTAFSKLLMR